MSAYAYAYVEVWTSPKWSMKILASMLHHSLVHLLNGALNQQSVITSFTSYLMLGSDLPYPACRRRLFHKFSSRWEWDHTLSERDWWISVDQVRRYILWKKTRLLSCAQELTKEFTNGKEILTAVCKTLLSQLLLLTIYSQLTHNRLSRFFSCELGYQTL